MHPGFYETISDLERNPYKAQCIFFLVRLLDASKPQSDGVVQYHMFRKLMVMDN